jgi:ribosome biogenesis GTPase
LIDTPGIKGFGLVDFEEEMLANYFPEFLELLPACKFNNCKHINEPKCAVLEALNEGEIAESRYISYRSMLESETEKYRSS